MATKNPMHNARTFPPFYLKDWQLKVTDSDYQLIRTFELANQGDARRFAAKVLQIGDALKQMPTVYIYQKWVCVVWRIIRPDGLHLNDVILPTSINDAYQNWHIGSVVVA